MLYPSTCVGFGYGLNVRAVSWDPDARPTNPLRSDNRKNPSPLTGTRMFTCLPIDYAFRPRLRDRLTLRRLTLRRNPWTFGDEVLHSVCRYSCQHSHFQCLPEPSRVSLHRPTERSATAPEDKKIQTTDDRTHTRLTRSFCSIRVTT